MFGKIIYVQESTQHGVSERAKGKHSESLSQNAACHEYTDMIHIFDELLKQGKKKIFISVTQLLCCFKNTCMCISGYGITFNYCNYSVDVMSSKCKT